MAFRLYNCGDDFIFVSVSFQFATASHLTEMTYKNKTNVATKKTTSE